MKGFAKKLYAWMITIDPGLTRLEKAGVALFSVTSAWLIMRAILQTFGSGLARPEYLGVALFAPIITLACDLVIIDLRPLDRRNTLLMSILPIAFILTLFTILATLFPQNPWIFGFILLVLFFFSFYLRPFGARMGELLLVTTITFYFVTLVKITFAVLPWFLLTVLVGVLSIYLWQFVLIRYNPVRLLRRTSASYYQIVSMGVGEIIRILRKKRHLRIGRRVWNANFRGYLHVAK